LAEFNRDTPSVVKELRLPCWTESSKLAFPEPQPPAGLVLAATMPTDHPRYGREWAAAKQAEITARRVEEQRNIEAEAAAAGEDKRKYERALVAR